MEWNEQDRNLRKRYLNFAEEYNKNVTASRDKIIPRIILLNGGGLTSVMALLLNPSASLHSFRFTALSFAIGLFAAFMISIFDYLYDTLRFKKLISKAPRHDEKIPDSTAFFDKALAHTKVEQGLRKLGAVFVYVGCGCFIAGMICGAYDFLSLTGFTHTELLAQKIECPEICSSLNKFQTPQKIKPEYSKAPVTLIKHPSTS